MTTGEREVLTEERLAFLRSVDSATLANAIEAFDIRDRTEGFVGGGVRSYTPDFPPMVGYAVTATMTSVPGPNASGHWPLFELLEQSPSPAVVVIKDISGRPNRAAYWGDVTTTIAKRLGAVGIVTDGAVRDIEMIRPMEFHVHASFVVVSHANAVIPAAGEAVEVDGQVIETGDILHGDANGVVVVPAEILGDLPAAVEEVRERERLLMEFARTGEFTVAGAKSGAFRKK